MYDLESAKSQFSKYRDSSFRPFQKEAIEFALNSEKKIVIIEAATGSGKSLISMVSGAAVSGCTCLVHSRVLQKQYTDDFPEADSLFGRSNYTCLNNPEVTCDECHHAQQSPCKLKNICLYEQRKRKVLKARFKILNYDYFLAEANYIGRFSSSNLIVIDEADGLEGTLINFTTLTFTPFALRRLGMLKMAEELKMTSKFKDQLLQSWKDFGLYARERVNKIIKQMSNEIDSFGDNMTESQMQLIKERTKVVRLKEKVDLFLSNIDSDWILDIQDGKLIWRPLWMTPELAEAYLWRHGKKFILMSASFYPRNILAKCLGLDVDDMDYYMVPSQFPVENRPVYIHPISNMTAKTIDIELPKMIPVIKQIADSRPNVKGIIHAVSYKLARQIVDGADDPRFITHNSTDRQQVLDMFMQSDNPLILVSPSLERGVSMEEDKCRFIIIAKAPYLSLGDRIVSTRLYGTKYIGNEWYKSTMMLTLLQMAGRGCRSKTDFCETFVLDLQAKKAIIERPAFLPTWWLDALQFELPSDINTKTIK